MPECKCVRNLMGFAFSKPVFVIFTVCLAGFAVGLFLIGNVYLINKELGGLIVNLQKTTFCLFGNETTMTSPGNSTLKTSFDEPALVPVSFSVLLNLGTMEKFISPDKHVTHLTTMIHSSEIGMKNDNSLNMTISLTKPLESTCTLPVILTSASNQLMFLGIVSYWKYGWRSETLDGCAVLKFPKSIVPENFLQSPDCNATAVHTVAHMSAQINAPDKWCHHGIKTFVTPVLLVHPASNQMVENKALMMQCSSYFLFVMVITCVLYGMIKGKPLKNGKR